MQISLKRTTKTYQAGDEVTAQIVEVGENNGNLGLKLAIIEGNKPGTTIFYHTIGAYAGNGRYYLELLLNHLNAPEDGEITLQWFVGKRITCILGDYTNPSTKKTYINLASYVNRENFSEEKIDPFGQDNDLSFDVPFTADKKVETEEPTSTTENTQDGNPTKKKKVKKEETELIRPDYISLLDE